MSNGVTPVQQIAQSTLTFIRGDNVRLVARGGKDSGLQDVSDTIEATLTRLHLAAHSSENGVRIFFQSSKFFFTRDSGSLNNLSHTINEFPHRQCFQKFEVDVDS